MGLENLIVNNISLVIFLPLWIFLIIMAGRFFGILVNKKIIYFLTLGSSALGAVVSLFGLKYLKDTVSVTLPFLNINNFNIDCGIYIDKVSLIFALLLYIISLIVQVFSISYMKNDTKNYRFFAYLNLFNFAMSLMLFSINLFQTYVFWELIGVVSYILIGFDYTNEQKSDASKRVFIMNRFGDTAFVAGILISAGCLFCASDYSLISLSLNKIEAISTTLFTQVPTQIYCIICALFIISACVKSAQFPFYTWLQDAMEAKLPVSALLHSATMVAAGTYLVIRLIPLFEKNTHITSCISIIGISTLIICSILACLETNYKKILAYSTSANFGIIFLALGIQNIPAAVAALSAHAITKSMLFMLLPDENNNISPAGIIVFIIGSLSLSGIILSGIPAKEFLYSSLHENQILALLYSVGAFFAAFYILRMILEIIKKSNIVKKVKYAEIIPASFLLVLNVYLYFYLSKMEYNLGLPFWSALGGLATAYVLFNMNKLKYVNKTPQLLNKFYNNILVVWYSKISQACNFADTKIFSNYQPFIIVSKSSIKFFNAIETNIMNEFVDLTVYTSKAISKQDMMIQNGNVQNYNAYALIIVTTIIALVIIAYLFIIGQMN